MQNSRVLKKSLFGDRNTLEKSKEDKSGTVHQELVMTSSSSSDEPGGVPAELRQFLNSPVIDRRIVL